MTSNNIRGDANDDQIQFSFKSANDNNSYQQASTLLLLTGHKERTK